MSRFNSRNMTVRFEDSAGLGMTFGPGIGDLSIGENEFGNTEKIPVYDRGVFEDLVEGQDLVQECSLTLGLKQAKLTDPVTQTIIDFLLKQGAFSAAQSLSSCDGIWAFKVIVTMSTASVTTTITLPYCTGRFSFSEAMEGNSIAISLSNYKKIVYA